MNLQRDVVSVERSSETLPSIAPVAPATAREHLITVVLGLWMMVGLFLDGYFHQNLESDTESFFTVWHGVFYSGFIGSMVWLGVLSERRAPRGRFTMPGAFVPPGYEWARAGIVLFAAGGTGDALWHTAFGVERGIDALLSPTHLLLFAGLVLILTAPLRAAVSVPGHAPSPRMIAGSLVATTSLVAFFLNFVWGLGISALVRTAYDPVTEVGELAVIGGVGSTLVTTTVLFVALRTWLRYDCANRGVALVLFAVVASLVSVAFDEDVEGVVAAVLAALVVEVLLAARAHRMIVFGAGAGVLWLAYFGLLAGLDGVEWQPEIWFGAVVLNALAAATLGVDQPNFSRVVVAGDRPL